MTYRPIYLDSHATTPVSQAVLQAMLPYFTEFYGNGNHKFGWKAASAMEQARVEVSALLGARPSEIMFTSGATESINLGIQGLIQANTSTRKHIITQRTEHSAVLKTIAALEQKGYHITILEVDPVGRIDLDELEKAVTEDSLLVAIMLANNEIGTVQPVREIGQICREAGAMFFCDLTQGLGWYPIDVQEMKIDLAAMSSHKIYGPRGVGALYVRRFRPRIKIDPIVFGGGQERDIRPGTANVPGIVGFGKACELQRVNGSENTLRIRAMRDRLQELIFSEINGVILNGCPEHRHPANLNIAIPHVSGEDLIGALPHIIFSTGSACTSGSAKPSYVISALTKDEMIRRNSFRFGMSMNNTMGEIEYVGQEIIRVAKRLQMRRNVFQLGP